MGMLSKMQRQLLERATLAYMDHLHLAEKYLDGRGIDLEVARSNGLGVVVDPVPGHEYLVGRLSIPYLTGAGPVNMNFRCIHDHKCREHGHKKYMTMSGMNTNLYGVQYLDEADDYIVISEGEIDCITSNMAGIPCVGVSGANKWEKHWNNIFEDFPRVYVWQEGDKAGAEFAKMVSGETGAVRILLPDDEDVNSIYTSQGPDTLRDMIRK